MTNKRTVLVAALAILLLSAISFSFFYTVFNTQKEAPVSGEEKTDELSETSYFSGDTQNYKEVNPYGSAFIGFDELRERGVEDGDLLYIEDVLTNLAMYDLEIFNGRISYVKDSFDRQNQPGDMDAKYSFRFGVNDGNIHTVKISSNWVNEMMNIVIEDTSGDEVFNKRFRVFAS